MINDQPDNQPDNRPDNPVAPLAASPPIDRADAIARLVAQCQAGMFLRATPTLAATAAEYHSRKGRLRAGADPLGIGGLPDTRAGLNAVLLDLCQRLIVQGGEFLRSDQLVEQMSLSNERTLRLLVAYGRVHHHIRAIVGIYGEGYCWADLADNPAALYVLARGQATATARCHLFLSTLFGRDDGAIGLVQLVFPFAQAPVNDDLAALLTAKGIGHEQVLEAMIAHCRAAGQSGVDAIRRVAARNRDVMFSAERLADIRARLARAIEDLTPVFDEAPAG